MSALKKTQKVFSALSLIGNFIEKPLRVGDIVLSDDGQHLIWGNIEDVVDGFSLKGKTTEGNKADLKFDKESSISVTVGASGTAGVASGEIQLKFAAKNSAFVSLKQVQITSLKLALVDTELKKYWKEKGFDRPRNLNKYHLITEVMSAQSGTVIFSSERNNSVILKGKNDTKLTSVASIGSGSVEYVSNSKSTLEIISETPIQPLYRAVRYSKKGNFELVG